MSLVSPTRRTPPRFSFPPPFSAPEPPQLAASKSVAPAPSSAIGRRNRVKPSSVLKPPRALARLAAMRQPARGLAEPNHGEEDEPGYEHSQDDLLALLSRRLDGDREHR